MKGIVRVWLIGLVVVLTGVCARGREETTWDYTADFEDGVLLDWEYDEEAVSVTGGGGDGGELGLGGGLEPAGGGADSSLHISRAAEAVLRDREFGAVAAEVEVQGNGGIRVGGRHMVLLDSDAEGQRVLRVMSGESSRQVSLGGRPGGGAEGKGRRLKVVCAGSLLRAYLDGHVAFERMDARTVQAPVALVAGEEGALFDDFRISTTVTPEEGTAAAPAPETDALVFTAGKVVEVPLRMMNRSEHGIRLVAEVKPFRGIPLEGEDHATAVVQAQPVIAYGVHKYYRIETSAETTYGAGETAVEAGAEGEAGLKVAKLPVGLHMLELSFHREGQKLSSRMYPLVVVEPDAQREYRRPAVPIAVYSRYMHYRRKTKPLWWKTYVHAIAADLRRHNITAIVACGGFDEGEIDIYNRYGIAGITRGGRYLDHPGVIASFVSDEPHPGEEMEQLKAQYAKLRERTDKVVTTCMIGGGLGLGGPGDPVNLWKELQPQLRVFRWYGVKKHFYGILHSLHYKGRLPYTTILRIAETSHETPWWIVLPAFGGDQHEAYFQNPAPAQLRGMMHLAMAYGADGMVLFQYQIGMVDPVTLRPRDGKLTAAGEVAARIGAHGDFFATMKRAGLDVRCPSPVVDALPVQSEAEERLCVYLVNRNTKQQVSTRIMLWDEVWDMTRVEELFAGTDLEVGRNDEGYLTVPVVLNPGEGKLIATDARVNK